VRLCTVYLVSLICGLSVLVTGPAESRAAEGATSFYFPGLYGGFGPALTPEPGIHVFNAATLYTARTDLPILNIPANQSYEGYAFINLARGYWVTDYQIMGARFAVGIRIPYVKIALDVDWSSPLGTLSFDADTAGRGDLGIIPVSLFWNRGKFYFNLYETVTMPTGKFDSASFPNASRNHWSFDTVLAMSWTDLERGLEVAAVPGVIVNSENPATDYRTGSEFHVDIMLNKLVTPAIGVGLHGSYYRQITGDSRAGAFNGPFKGRAATIGPALLLRPKIAGRQGYIAIKWLHEFAVENRFSGDLYIVNAGLKF
jgi:hypothetical protein